MDVTIAEGVFVPGLAAIGSPGVAVASEMPTRVGVSEEEGGLATGMLLICFPPEHACAPRTINNNKATVYLDMYDSLGQ